MQNFKEQILFRDYLRIFYRHKIFFIIIPISLILPLYLNLKLTTPSYVAQVKMLIKAQKKTEAEYYKESDSQSLISEHLELVKSNIVLKRVVEALKLYERPIDYEKRFAPPLKAALINYRLRGSMSQFEKMSPEEKKDLFFDSAVGNLSSSISVDQMKDSSLFTISVADFDGAIASKIANSVSRSYVMFDLEQQIEELKLKYGEKHSTVTQLENYIQDFQKTLDGNPIPDIDAIGPASIKIIAQSAGASPRVGVPKNILLAATFVFGIFSAAIFCFLVDYFDNTLKTPKDIISNLNLPFLGSIPKRKKNDELIMSDELLIKSSLQCVTSFQRLGDKLCLLSKKENIKTFLITSFQEVSDTSALIANLGIYLARDAMKRVLIIDANLINPTLAKAFHISENKGLPDIFERKKSFEEAMVKIGKNLDILLSHTVSYRPIALLDTSFMSDLIKEVRDKYDFVLLDCSVDIKRDTEAGMLSSLADAVILVVNEGIDRTQDAQIAIENLKENSNKVIYSVLNNRKEDIPKILYKIS